MKRLPIQAGKASKAGMAVVAVLGIAAACLAAPWWKDDAAAAQAPVAAHRPAGATGGASRVAAAAAHGGAGDANAGDGVHAAQSAAGTAPQPDPPAGIPMSGAQIAAAGIALAQAGPAEIRAAVQFPGEVKFNDDRTAHVVPRVAGVAETVHVSLGQQVKKGQVLAVLASPELADLRSAYFAAQQRRDLAQATHDREKKLWQDGIAAEQDYLQARHALQEASIQVQSARAKLAALGAGTAQRPDDDHRYDRYVLRAPFDGVVVEKHIAPGEAVKSDANVVVLSDLSSVWVEFPVSARDLGAVRVGARAEIASADTRAGATGKVGHVASLLGGQSRSAQARVAIANPDMAWRPGLFVSVSVAGAATAVPVAVPAEAIHTVEGQSVVYVRTAQGFYAAPVRTGEAGGGKVAISAGLAPGAVVAAAGSYAIKAQQGKDGADHDH